jgi:hypothetical protein
MDGRQGTLRAMTLESPRASVGALSELRAEVSRRLIGWIVEAVANAGTAQPMKRLARLAHGQLSFARERGAQQYLLPEQERRRVAGVTGKAHGIPSVRADAKPLHVRRRSHVFAAVP